MNPTLYEKDYYFWLEETAQLLQDGRLAELDIQNLVEEITGMSRRERDALYSNLKRVLQHLLKYRYQPQRRSNSWRTTIREHRQRIKKAFKDSPSLKNYYLEIFADCYQNARELAADETGLAIQTFPLESPFTPEEILDSDYLPE